MESGRRAAGSATGNGHARGLRRARPVQPSQDKPRPAQRTRPRDSTPGSRRGAPRTSSGGGRASTHIRTQTEADRHGRSMALVYRTDHTRFPVTQRGVSTNNGKGWGSNLALFQTDSYISARRNSLSAREIVPMKQHNRMKAMPRPQHCAQQEFLRHLARLAGENAVTVWAVGKNHYQLSVRIQGKTQE